MGAVTKDRAIPRVGALAAAATVVVVAAVVALVVGLTDRTGGGTVRIGFPGIPTGIAATGDVVWVAAAESQAVWPIQASSGRQAARGITTGGAPSRLAVGAEGLWIADSARGSVIPVDIDAKQPLDAIGVGADVTDVALTAGAVWVASSAEGVVRAIEPGGQVRRLRVGRDPVDVAAAGRWVVTADAGGGTLTRIDARVRKAVEPAVNVGGVPVAVAVSGDKAWVADSAGGTVVSVDLARGRPGTTVQVGSKPVGVAVDGAEVWVLCRGDRTLVRVDGRDGDVLSRLELEVEPTAIALDDRYVWVASGPGREVLRIER